MKKIATFILILLFVCTICAATATAKEEIVGAEKFKQDLGLTLYVQAGYTANLNNPASLTNDLRVFDNRANRLNFDMFEILMEKEAKEGGPGYGFRIIAGETAKYMHSRGLGDPNSQLDITEAYITIPFGKKVKVDVGKFGTCIGAEEYEAINNFNYSRGLVFNYAQPLTHTGAIVGYQHSEKLKAELYLVNGWDNFTDNNGGKTVGLSLGYTPSDKLDLAFNFFTGPEQDGNNKNNRFLFDWVAGYSPNDKWDFSLNYDYGTEENVPGIGNATWHGVAGVASYNLSKKISIAVRGEWFKDNNGSRTGVPQTLTEFTITPRFKLGKGFYVMPEYRHDISNKRVFKNGASKTQDTVGVGVMYRW